MTDRSELFPAATCVRKDCLSFWSRWCRRCNLVYCGAHIKDHACKPDDRAAREELYVSDLTEELDPVEEGTCLPPPL
jgi:hypothetical protein